MAFMYNVLMAIKYGIKVLQCDVCGHRWLPEGDNLPKQCPSRKCRSAKWNHKETTTVRVEAIQAAIPSVQPASTLPEPAVGAVDRPAMTPRCPTHRLPMVRNDQTGIWSCRVTKCRHSADDEAVRLAFETADFAST